MLRKMCKGKIHRATITEANLEYEGSITIDRNLLDEADIIAAEEVQVVNVNNGERFERYGFEGERCSSTVALNGAAARKAVPGDLVIIISYGFFESSEAIPRKPRVVSVDEGNRIVENRVTGTAPRGNT